MVNTSIILGVDGRVVLPSSANTAQDPVGGARSSTQSVQASIREPTERMESAKEVILSRNLDFGEKCEILSVDLLEDQDSSPPLGEISPTSVSSDPGSPGPPCPKKADSTTTESLEMLQESFVQDVSNSRREICEESEELRFLDARASTVLERCRRLLAMPSTTSAQVRA